MRPDPELRPPPTRWGVIFAFWSIPVVVEVAQGLLGQATGTRPLDWPALLRAAVFWYSVALATPVVFALARRVPLRRPGLLRALATHWAAGSGLVLAACLVLTAIGARPALSEGEPAGLLSRFQELVLWMYLPLVLLYGLLVAIGAGLDLRRRYRDQARQAAEAESRTVELERALAAARLEALRLQLQPHFLFNTLHAISALVDDDPAAARRMIAGLGDLLRTTLESDRLEQPLRDEIRFLESYLEIERVRLGSRLRVEYDLAEAALDSPVPSLILQPLVENSIRHAVAPSLDPRSLRVAARIRGSDLVLTVADDGPGPGPDQPEPRSAGVGLVNTRERLRHAYGEQGRLEVDDGAGRGFLVRVILPAPGVEADAVVEEAGP